MQEYVLGFLFDKIGNIVLIKKTKPEWQAGRLNAVGGHIEDGEDSFQAIVRKFQEETGVLYENWECVNFFEDGFQEQFQQTYRVFVFKGLVDDLNEIGVKTCTEEEVGIYKLSNMLLGEKMLLSAQWLSLMCLDNNLNGIVVTC